MKKRLLIIASCCLTCMAALAQKTQTVQTTTTTAHSEKTYQFTQGRMPQLLVEPLVKPLVVEVEVMESAPSFWKKTLTRQKVEVELEGKLENVQNYGVFLFSTETNADMIVGATYNFYTNPERNGDKDWYILEIKGFPAKFSNWHTATEKDYEWMRIRHEGANNKTK